MELIFRVLFISTVALTLPVKDIHHRFTNLIETVEFIEETYHNLPDPKLHYKNASSIIRLSDHLKLNFEELREQIFIEMCGGNSKCNGSPAFQRGVIKLCLHSDDYVSRQVELYENFVKCSEIFLTELIKKSENTDAKMEELIYSKRKLMMEYNDVENRNELDMVLDYHEQIIHQVGQALLNNIESLQNLYADVENSLNSCSQPGYPRINRKLYRYSSVQQCLRDFLSHPRRDDSSEVPYTSTDHNEDEHTTDANSNQDFSEEDYRQY